MAKPDIVVVIGLGRFGEALALELVAQGTEVFGIDTDERLVQKMAGLLTHTVVADCTDEEALRQLGVDEQSRVVVGSGTDIEASILVCSVLQSFGIRDLWAKAISEPHARILTQLGVDHVVRPEHDTGRRVAHLVAGRMLDYIEFDDGFAIVKMRPPRSVVGTPLETCTPRRQFGVTVVGVKRAGEDFHHATGQTVVEEGDLIIVSGERAKVEAFAEQNAV